MIRDIYIKGVASSTPPVPAGYVRPADWLPMPAITSADEEIAILHAVWDNDSNYAAFRCTTSAGLYNVSWGDGTVTSHASNTVAEHDYDYDTYDVAENTLSSRGYKQAIIRITPATGTLATFNSNFRYTGQNQIYATGFLDVLLSMPSAASVASILFQSTLIRHRYMEQVHILNKGGMTSASAMFQNCTALLNVPLFDTSIVTLMGQMFNACSSLQTVPLFDTSSASTMVNMFLGCTNLQIVPLFDTSSVTNMSNMFTSCVSLQEIPAFITTSVTVMTGLSNACSSMSKTDIVCRVSVSFLNNQLSQAGLVNIFNNLFDRTGLAAANINITGNYGAAALSAPERAIATNKNFTITG